MQIDVRGFPGPQLRGTGGTRIFTDCVDAAWTGRSTQQPAGRPALQVAGIPPIPQRFQKAGSSTPLRFAQKDGARGFILDYEKRAASEMEAALIARVRGYLEEWKS